MLSNGMADTMRAYIITMCVVVLALSLGTTGVLLYNSSGGISNEINAISNEISTNNILTTPNIPRWLSTGIFDLCTTVCLICYFIIKKIDIRTRTVHLHEDFVVIAKSEIIHKKNTDFQYVSLEDRFGEKYVVKALLCFSNHIFEGDVVEACFDAVEFADRTECEFAVILPKEETEKSEE